MKKITKSLFFIFISWPLMAGSYKIDYEERLKASLNENNAEMSATKIKLEALKLKAWSDKEFFQNDVKKFLQQDKEAFPEEDGILFIGSSSIRFWLSLESDMRPFPVINRGFGGAQIVHVNNHLEEIVFPYKPKAIVFYCGSNDLAGLKTPEEVFSDFQYFLTAISQHLPEAKLFVIGVKPSPSREYQKNKQISLNNMIRNLSDTNDYLYFLDVRPSMLLTSGKADPSLFVKDMLHMNKKGYEVWTRIVKTALIENL